METPRQSVAKLANQKQWYQALFEKADNWEFQLCCKANRLANIPLVKRFFCMVSRLGDGCFWYLVMAAMPLLLGDEGTRVSFYLIFTGLVCTICYKQLKRKLTRERPFVSFSSIQAATPPLDQYSFPSGHTMHAVCFNTVLAIFTPIIALVILPFTLLVMLSRVILGLHYPSDVLVGALLGSLIALTLSLSIDLTHLHLF